MKNTIKKLLRGSLIKENLVSPPNIPNTMNFWHGGNLDEYSDIIAQKNGRYEFGAGLYLITKYDIAKRYAKGSRKLYIVTVEKGNDIQDSFLDIEKCIDFVKTYVLVNKRKEIFSRLNEHNKDGKIKAYIFNNLIINHKAIKSSYTKYLRAFLVKNNIDYEIVNNAFGFGEDMMVLYNMNKIVNTIIFKPKDRMDNYDFRNIS